MTWTALRLTGIRRALVVAIAVLMASIAVFVAIFFPRRLEQQAMRAMVTKASSIGAMTAHSVRAALVFGDTAGVHEVLEATLADREVACARIDDAQGQLVAMVGTSHARTGHARATGMSADGQWYVSTGAIAHGSEPIGRVTITFSLAAVRTEVARARRAGLAFGALLLVFGVWAGYAVALLVTRSLHRVAAEVREIREGNLALRAQVPSDPDVAEVVHAFNATLDGLAAAQRQLADVNAGLEQRVRERTETLRLFIEVTPQPIITVDLQRRVTLWNRMAETLFGWSASEVLGQPLPYVPPEGRDGFDEIIATLRSGQTIAGAEVVRMKKDGTRVPLLLAASALRDGAGEVIGCAAVLTDLTERKALEQQLSQSQKMEAVGRLAGGIAHDFNNILTVITATSSLLLESELAGQQRTDIQEIERAAHRAAALTRQLLAFSRSKAVQLEPVQISEVAHELHPMLRRILRENVKLAVIAGPTHPIRGDVTEIEQVIMNLVVNASDAMPRGGTLTVRAENVALTPGYAREHPDVVPGDYVMISVADTGTGMTPDILSRIFEPFFTTKPIGKGTGLGLATTYAIVRRLGGSIDVKSKVGAGTVFRIYLPRMRDGQAPRDRRLDVTARTLAGSERVLLVEDEAGVRVALHRSLERLGYDVMAAADGEEGLAVLAAAERPIDIVVTDIMMPGMNGPELARALSLTHPELRVIFMTGYADDTVGDGVLVDDTHRFLHKPVTGAELARTIREFARCPGGEPTADDDRRGGEHGRADSAQRVAAGALAP